MISIPFQKKEFTAVGAQPSYIKRFFAFVIDWYLGSMLVSFPVSIAYYRFFPQQATVLDLRVLPLGIACLTLMASVLIALWFYVMLPYQWNGQTLGKKLMKLRIIEKGKTQITWKALLLRQLLGIILIEGSVYAISPMIYQMICYGSEMALSGITYLHYALTILSVVICIVTQKRRAIHDYIANTAVEAV